MMAINTAAIDGLRAWGDQLMHTAAQLPKPNVGRAMTPDQAFTGMGRVHADQIHTAGWEITQALAPRNDNRCGQKALLAAQAVAQRSFDGDMHAAMANLGQVDGRRGALLTVFRPKGVADANGRPFISHTAPVFIDHTGTAQVIDDLASDAPDSVMSFRDWLQRLKATPDDVVVTSAMADIPSPGSAGIPARATPLAPDAWPRVADALVDSWRGLPYERHNLTH